MVNKIDIEIGMRVLDTSGRKMRIGTVMELTRPQPREQQPDYARVRYESFWRRDEWVHVMHLNPLESEIPTTSEQEVSAS